MHQSARKDLYEFWLQPEDILKLPDVWLNIDNWLSSNSTHEYAKAGFRMKITSNARSVPRDGLFPYIVTGMYDDYEWSDARSNAEGPLVSDKIRTPVRNTGKTKVRIYQPLTSANKFSVGIVLPGVHFCPETVFNDLMTYNYYSQANMNVALRHPSIKSAEQILDEVPFELLLKAHNERMKREIGDYRPEPPKFDMSKVLHLKRLKEARRKKFAPPLKEEKYA